MRTPNAQKIEREFHRGFCCTLKGAFYYPAPLKATIIGRAQRVHATVTTSGVSNHSQSSSDRVLWPLRRFAPLRSACASLTICSNQSGKFGL